MHFSKKNKINKIMFQFLQLWCHRLQIFKKKKKFFLISFSLPLFSQFKILSFYPNFICNVLDDGHFKYARNCRPNFNFNKRINRCVILELMTTVTPSSIGLSQLVDKYSLWIKWFGIIRRIE